jgi:hypothetical protein
MQLFKTESFSNLRNKKRISDEGGFEPPILIQYAGFQDRYLKPLRHSSQKIKNCLEADSNCRHKDFQSFALPTELSRRFLMSRFSCGLHYL